MRMLEEDRVDKPDHRTLAVERQQVAVARGGGLPQRVLDTDDTLVALEFVRRSGVVRASGRRVTLALEAVVRVVDEFRDVFFWKLPRLRLDAEVHTNIEQGPRRRSGRDRECLMGTPSTISSVRPRLHSSRERANSRGMSARNSALGDAAFDASF